MNELEALRQLSKKNSINPDDNLNNLNNANNDNNLINKNLRNFEEQVQTVPMGYSTLEVPNNYQAQIDELKKSIRDLS